MGSPTKSSSVILLYNEEELFILGRPERSFGNTKGGERTNGKKEELQVIVCGKILLVKGYMCSTLRTITEASSSWTQKNIRDFSVL
jgi:hypothetical protein